MKRLIEIIKFIFYYSNMLRWIKKKEGFEVGFKNDLFERQYKGFWDKKARTFTLDLQSDNYESRLNMTEVEFLDWYAQHMDGDYELSIHAFYVPLPVRIFKLYSKDEKVA